MAVFSVIWSSDFVVLVELLAFSVVCILLAYQYMLAICVSGQSCHIAGSNTRPQFLLLLFLANFSRVVFLILELTTYNNHLRKFTGNGIFPTHHRSDNFEIFQNEEKMVMLNSSSYHPPYSDFLGNASSSSSSSSSSVFLPSSSVSPSSIFSSISSDEYKINSFSSSSVSNLLEKSCRHILSVSDAGRMMTMLVRLLMPSLWSSFLPAAAASASSSETNPQDFGNSTFTDSRRKEKKTSEEEEEQDFYGSSLGYRDGDNNSSDNSSSRRRRVTMSTTSSNDVVNNSSNSKNNISSSKDEDFIPTSFSHLFPSSSSSSSSSSPSHSTFSSSSDSLSSSSSSSSVSSSSSSSTPAASVLFSGKSTWYHIMFRSLPSLIFLSSYSVVILFWAEVYYKTILVETPLLRPLFVYFNLAGYLLFSVIALLTFLQGASSEFRVYSMFFIGSVYCVVAFSWIYYGLRVFHQLRIRTRYFYHHRHSQDDLSSRILGLCLSCPLLFLFRGSYNILVAINVIHRYYPPGIPRFLWDACVYIISEWFPSFIILFVFWNSKTRGADDVSNHTTNPSSFFEENPPDSNSSLFLQEGEGEGEGGEAEGEGMEEGGRRCEDRRGGGTRDYGQRNDDGEVYYCMAYSKCGSIGRREEWEDGRRWNQQEEEGQRRASFKLPTSSSTYIPPHHPSHSFTPQPPPCNAAYVYPR